MVPQNILIRACHKPVIMWPRVVSDIVRRYDIDAIHMDDYFYPYRIAGLNFPDDSSFAAYHGKFYGEQRDDWRRNNVDLIIKQLHDSIKAIKPYWSIWYFSFWCLAQCRQRFGRFSHQGRTDQL